jgi:hypothetical protein
MRCAARRLLIASVLAFIQLACESESVGPAAPGPGNQANDRIAIVNDSATLAAGVTYYDEEVPVDASGVGYPAAAMSASLAFASRAPLSLRLRAEVSPPVVSGQALQATSVSMVGDRAVVSYAMRGAEYIGAIDVFDVSNKNRPVLRSRASFQNTDINAVSTYGSLVLAAEATGDAGFDAPAVLEVMYLQGNNLILNGNWRLPLSSYAGTSATVSGSRGYATSGDNGGLFVIDASSYPAITIDSISLHDARWIAVGEGKIVAVQGTPGQLSVYNESTRAPLGTFSFTGADIPESKSTVELVGGKAFIAAGAGGVQILSATTGTVVGSIPRPDPAALGLDPAVVVTNAASVDRDLLLISNGEAGVYVAQGSQDFAASGSETAQQIMMLGKLRFANLQSVNHVALRNNYLIIAAGLGGLKIVSLN